MIKRIILVLPLLLFSAGLYAQSETTDKLHKKYSDSFSLFFYNNTLRMLNQSEDKAFDELIRDIEKMKVLVVKKATANLNYKDLVSDYKKESFEAIVTSRHEGKSFDVFMKERSGKTKGVLVLVNDAESLYVLDIVGSIALDKVTSLYSMLDSNNEVARKIKGFLGDEKEEKHAEHGHHDGHE